MVIDRVNTYLEQHDYVDVDLGKDKRAEVLDGINAVVRPYLKEFGRRKEYIDLKPALRRFSDYESRRTGEAIKNLYRISRKK